MWGIALELKAISYRPFQHRSTVLGTEDAFLLEFVCSSVAKYNRVDRWGGMLHDGRICGHNQQGALQMHVRLLLDCMDNELE